jgi:hypothetical protein
LVLYLPVLGGQSLVIPVSLRSGNPRRRTRSERLVSGVVGGRIVERRLALLGIVAIELATLAGTNGHSWGDAVDRDRIEPTRSEPMVVAEPVELAPTQAGGYVVSPWMQAEPAVASLLQSHPPLGSTPLTNKFLEQRRSPDTDAHTGEGDHAVRRMETT